MARIAEIEDEADNSIVVASGLETSSSLTRHFNYELSDKKAKSNLLKGAARESFEIDEKQKCTMMTFSVGSYLKVVIPTVVDWCNGKKRFTAEDLDIEIEEFAPGYDENQKHVETLIKFQVNKIKIPDTLIFF